MSSAANILPGQPMTWTAPDGRTKVQVAMTDNGGYTVSTLRGGRLAEDDDNAPVGFANAGDARAVARLRCQLILTDLTGEN